MSTARPTSRRWRQRLPAAALSLALTLAGGADAARAQTKPLLVHSVQVAREGHTIVVVVEADGPLPVPVTGSLDSPPRFFLDFPGAITGIRDPQTGSGAVKRVRVALNSSSPPVTRVVLDLAQPQPVRVDTAARAAGRVRIVVGAGASGAEASTTSAAESTAERTPVSEPPAPLIPRLPPVPPLPVSKPPTSSGSSQAPATALSPSPAAGATPPAERPSATPDVNLPPPEVYPVKTGTPPPKPSADDVSRYRDQVLPSITQLLALRPLLTEIDRQDAKVPDGLAAARSNISGVIRALAGVRPPDALAATHDMLLRGASLSMMAATLRADAGTRADPTAIRNASSAAAGALLLLDRVCIEVGCNEAPGRK